MSTSRVVALAGRCRVMLAAFGAALAQFWEGYMHPAPGC